jgi:hypothetical protein
MSARPAHHAWHCHGNNHSLHLAWKTARYTPSAACVLPVVSRHDLRVYAAGYADEEDLCVEGRGVGVRRKFIAFNGIRSSHGSTG